MNQVYQIQGDGFYVSYSTGYLSPYGGPTTALVPDSWPREIERLTSQCDNPDCICYEK